MFTGRQLAKYCEDVFRAGWVYWYGTVGYKCSQSLYNSKKKQYPSHYTADRTTGYMKDIAQGRMCADCVGLIKSFFWSGGQLGGASKYASNGCPDVSANGMIALCPQTGAIKTIPDEPGLVVWKSGHIGVYIGGGYTIEMRGFAYDCVKRRVTDGPWTKWGRLPKGMIEYGEGTTSSVTPQSGATPSPEGEGKETAAAGTSSGADAPPDARRLARACDPPEGKAFGDTEQIGERELRNGCVGEDVRQMQIKLITLGFSCGRWGADGEFGDCTEMAVEDFQRAQCLKVSGVYDSATRAELENAMEVASEAGLPGEHPRTVRIQGGNCYVRSAPNTTTGKKLGVVYNGDELPYGGVTSDDGWNLVEYKGKNGWVSGKYSVLI